MNDQEKELMDIFIALKSNSLYPDFNMPRGGLMVCIMEDLQENGKISLSHLRKKIGLAPSSITPVITKLENKGLLLRQIDPKDRRNIFLVLTPKGSEYIKIMQQKMQENLKNYTEYLGVEDTNSLIHLMKRTIDYFEERKKNT